MELRKIMVILLAIVMVLAFAACGSSGDSPPADTGSSTTVDPPASDAGADGEVDKSDWINLDLNAASYLPANETIMWLQDNYTDGVVKALGEEYCSVTWHNSGTLVTQDGAVDGLKAGTCDIAMIELTSFSDQFPVSNLWCQPGLGSGGSTGGTAAFTEWAQQNAWDLPEYKDMVFLSGQNNGPAVIISKNPIKSPADLKGVQFRATATISPTVEAFGGTPIVIPAMETYEALRNGMVTASYATFGGQAILGWTEFCPNVLAMVENSEVYAYAMNKDVFNSMPPSQQQAFLDGWSDGFYNNLVPGWFWNMDILSPPIVGGAAACTWTFLDPGTPEANAFTELGKPVLEAYLEDLEADGVDTDAVVADIKKYQKKWIDDWYTFDDENELYLACVDGTLEDYKTNYKVPDGMPAPSPYLIP
jgi:TRAP-type C4-dicarboxylate transport system substrate-binding protein